MSLTAVLFNRRLKSVVQQIHLKGNCFSLILCNLVDVSISDISTLTYIFAMSYMNLVRNAENCLFEELLCSNIANFLTHFLTKGGSAPPRGFPPGGSAPWTPAYVHMGPCPSVQLLGEGRARACAGAAVEDLRT